MSSEPDPAKRWQQINQLLDETLSREPAKRQGFLEQACAGNEVLRREVETLLAAHDQATRFMEKPALDAVSQTLEQKESRSLVGRKLGPYEILSLLGRGGMGEVYRARDTRLDRIAALKILPSDMASDPERLRRFVREAKAASALNHSNIATIYEIGESDGIHWIAMELVEGETVAERLNRDGLEVAAILDIGIQAAEALEEAHSKGITHRDIKPANLMLTPKGKVKVLDFGLAKITRQESSATATATSETHTFPGLVMGTARYMSPEQILGQEVDHRTDLFSLGIVLYEMVTGRQAFSGLTSTVVFDAILHKVPTSPVRLNPKCSPELERIANKALEKDRDLRYQSALELSTDLKRLKRDGELERPIVEVRRRKSHRFLLWGTALLLVVITGAAGFWFLQPRNETAEAPLIPVPFTTYPGLATNPSFSPDGNQVAFSWDGGEKLYNFEIYLLSPETGEKRQLTSPPNGVVGDSNPAFSPDGRSLVFARRMGATSKLYLLRVADGLSPQGEPKQLTFSDQFAITPAWMPDGREIVYSSGSKVHDSILWRIPASGSGKPKPLPFSNERTAIDPAISLENHRLVYWTSSADINIWRCQIPGGREKPAVPSRFIASTRVQEAAQYSPDGGAVAYVTWASGSAEIWICDRDGTNPLQLTHLAGPSPYSPRWSPDGRNIVFSMASGGQNDLFRVPAQGGQMRQLTHTPFNEGSPSYSRDGKWIYFDSNRTGDVQVSKIPAEGGEEMHVTRKGGSKSTGVDVREDPVLFEVQRRGFCRTMESSR
jgi:eukaryotic-like serine/threonine-protein kinase